MFRVETEFCVQLEVPQDTPPELKTFDVPGRNRGLIGFQVTQQT